MSSCRAAPPRRAAECEVQSRIGAHHGDLPPARRRQRVRGAGLPHEHANDVAFRTTMTGLEFARIPIPCRRDRYTAKDGPDSWWPTPEPPHRINQIFLEPVLFEFAAAMPGLRYLNRVRCFRLHSDRGRGDRGGAGPGHRREAADHRRFLIGCDGGVGDAPPDWCRLTGDPMVSRCNPPISARRR